jgi:hypothetical protein
MSMDDDKPLPITIRTSPLSRAIGRAAEAHPSVLSAPQPLRSATRAKVSATANAMADAERADFCDADAAPDIASEMVDEAAMALGVHPERISPVHLRAEVLPRHRALAHILGSVPAAVRSGYDDPEAIARSEKAIGRAMRVRSSEIEHDPEAETALVTMMIGAMMRACIQRGTPPATLDDDELMELAQDACDASITETG